MKLKISHNTHYDKYITFPVVVTSTFYKPLCVKMPKNNCELLFRLYDGSIIDLGKNNCLESEKDDGQVTYYTYNYYQMTKPGEILLYKLDIDRFMNWIKRTSCN